MVTVLTMVITGVAMTGSAMVTVAETTTGLIAAMTATAIITGLATTAVVPAMVLNADHILHSLSSLHHAVTTITGLTTTTVRRAIQITMVMAAGVRYRVSPHRLVQVEEITIVSHP